MDHTRPHTPEPQSPGAGCLPRWETRACAEAAAGKGAAGQTPALHLESRFHQDFHLYEGHALGQVLSPEPQCRVCRQRPQHRPQAYKHAMKPGWMQVAASERSLRKRQTGYPLGLPRPGEGSSCLIPSLPGKLLRAHPGPFLPLFPVPHK